MLMLKKKFVYSEHVTQGSTMKIKYWVKNGPANSFGINYHNIQKWASQFIEKDEEEGEP